MVGNEMMEEENQFKFCSNQNKLFALRSRFMSFCQTRYQMVAKKNDLANAGVANKHYDSVDKSWMEIQ